MSVSLYEDAGRVRSYEGLVSLEDAQESARVDLLKAKDIVSRYVEQLLYGCGNSTCMSNVCDSGRRNTAKHPVRKYTPRSARAIAVTLAGGPKPRAHLCRSLRSGHYLRGSSSSDVPRDPAAFIQRLSDTTTITALCEPNLAPNADSNTSSPIASNAQAGTPLLSNGSGSVCHLQQMHAWLDTSPTVLGEHAAISNHPESPLRIIEDTLGPIIDWLFGQTPTATAGQWRYVNDLVSMGNTYPSSLEGVPYDTVHNSWLDILDSINDAHSLQIFCHVIQVVAGPYVYREHLSERLSTQATDKELSALRGLARWVIDRFSAGDRSALFTIWLKKAFLHHWDGHSNLLASPIARIALILLEASLLYLTSNPENRSHAPKSIQVPAVAARLNAVEAASTFLSNEATRKAHIFNYGFIFTLAQKATYLRTINHLKMRRAHSESEKATALRARAAQQSLDEPVDHRIRYMEDHYLLLNVSRGDALRDAFDQLWQRRAGELHRPLRVRLGEMDELEVGHDLGGVQIEFFNLCCREIFAEEAQMFLTDTTTGLSYFRAGSLQPLHMFELCGLLFGLAIYNGVTLPVHLPLAFYVILLNQQCRSPETLVDGWPVITRSLEAIPDDDISDMDAVVSIEANGLRVEVSADSRPYHDTQTGRKVLQVLSATQIVHQGAQRRAEDPTPEDLLHSPASNGLGINVDGIRVAWPGWTLVHDHREAAAITSESKKSYIFNYCFWITYGFMAPQWDAFKKGFGRVLDKEISFLKADELRALVEGSTHLDIGELMHATTYDGYDSHSKYILSFWRMLNGWPEEKQKSLLKFVTAAERIPAAGVSNLTFKIQKDMPEDLDRLPTSSTCFGTLTLPKYPSVEILDKKLSLALKYGLEGFGSG